MKKEIRVPSGVSNEVFESIVERRYANIVVGGKLTISTEMARGLYAMTTIKPPVDIEELNMQNEKCRFILRNIAKQILFTNGDTVSEDKLMDMFSTPSIVDVDPFDQPIDRKQQVDNIVEKM
jgi:hypothetical protein